MKIEIPKKGIYCVLGLSHCKILDRRHTDMLSNVHRAIPGIVSNRQYYDPEMYNLWVSKANELTNGLLIRWFSTKTSGPAIQCSFKYGLIYSKLLNVIQYLT